MRPSFPIQDSLHLLARDAKLPSNVFCGTWSDASNGATAQRVAAWLEFWITTDGAHHILCYFRLSVAFAQCRAFLRRAIAHIVGLGSEKKMVRADTSRVVAFVANVKTLRYWAKCYLPLKSSSHKIALLWSANCDNAVTLFRFAGFPFPATIGLHIFCMEQGDALLCYHLDKYITQRGAAQ